MHTTACPKEYDYSTRRNRREAVKLIISCLSAIRSAESRYLEKVPLNLQNTESFEVGECAVDTLDEIIDLLSDVY